MRRELWTAAVIVLLGLGDAALAAPRQPSRLGALAARQDLRGEVCVALADGRLSPAERFEILSDAKRILGPEELEHFTAALDRLAADRTAKTKKAEKQAAASKKATGETPKTPAATARRNESAPRPVIQTGAALPYRVATPAARR